MKLLAREDTVMQSVMPEVAERVVPTESIGGVPVPVPPLDLTETGVNPDFLAELALKIAGTVPRCSANWVATRICLPMQLVEECLVELAQEHLLDVIGLESPGNHRFALTGMGRERIKESLATSRYVGPAPVSIEAYTEMIQSQQAAFPRVSLEDVRGALDDLVFPEDNVFVAAIAVSSNRSLFIWGASGNGKTSLASALHRALTGELWIPHCINVGSEVLQVFDPSIHQRCEVSTDEPWRIDQRWVRIRRPLVIAGGETTLESLDLNPRENLGFYEMPLHVKANGGVFVVDDFGRQHVDPWAFLNRWIVPMECGSDFLPLPSGRKLKVPFGHFLIVATNLDPCKVTDPAFLRRMGYRVHLKGPDEKRYAQIVKGYAARHGLEVDTTTLDHLLGKYRAEGRVLRACEPRDLISRVEDICRLRGEPMRLDHELLDLAWAAYFGETDVVDHGGDLVQANRH